MWIFHFIFGKRDVAISESSHSKLRGPWNTHPLSAPDLLSEAARERPAPERELVGWIIRLEKNGRDGDSCFFPINKSLDFCFFFKGGP